MKQYRKIVRVMLQRILRDTEDFFLKTGRTEKTERQSKQYLDAAREHLERMRLKNDELQGAIDFHRGVIHDYKYYSTVKYFRLNALLYQTFNHKFKSARDFDENEKNLFIGHIEGDIVNAALPDEYRDVIDDQGIGRANLRTSGSTEEDTIDSNTVFSLTGITNSLDAITNCSLSGFKYAVKVLSNQNLIGDSALIGIAFPDDHQWIGWLKSEGYLPCVIAKRQAINTTEIPVCELRDWRTSETRFRIIVAPGTIEVLGLGWDGLPNDPHQDFRMLRELETILDDGGFVILTIPVGMDCVVSNLCRIYGRIGLADLLLGWEVVKVFGMDEAKEDPPCETYITLVLTPTSRQGKKSSGRISRDELNEIYDQADRLVDGSYIEDLKYPSFSKWYDSSNSENIEIADRLIRETARFARIKEVLTRQRLLISAQVRHLALQQWREFEISFRTFGPPDPTSPPIEKIPDEHLPAFTMGGEVEIEYRYLNNTYPSNWPAIYCQEEVDRYQEMMRSGDFYIYGMTDVWIQKALKDFPIEGLSVVQMGSLTPWYDAMCLLNGAITSTIIDYNTIISNVDKIRTMTVGDWESNPCTFDVGLSISSFEHDGLGAYGDPIDPEGDLKAMQKMKTIVEPGGLLIFSVPVGADKVVFNHARIYGRKRLPKMFEGWTELARYGLLEEHWEGPGHIQPVFVLCNDES